MRAFKIKVKLKIQFFSTSQVLNSHVWKWLLLDSTEKASQKVLLDNTALKQKLTNFGARFGSLSLSVLALQLRMFLKDH